MQQQESNNERRAEVLVIGGGISGLSAATQLHKVSSSEFIHSSPPFSLI